MAFPPKQAPAAPASPDAGSASGQSGPPGADPGAQAPQSITITTQPDGTYAVDDGSGQPKPAQSVDEVCQMIEQMLGGGGSPKDMWAAEAAKRGPSGQPMQPGTGGAGPVMSM